MHHIYHTEGIILGSRNYGEAGKCYYIFTRELGMVFASAQGVRKIESRLRYVLQDYAYIKVDLVRGRDFWRITSASKTNELEEITKNKEALKIFSNVSRLLRRLLQGEEANATLFDDLLKGLLVLEKTKTNEELINTELVLVLRILNNLGYIGGNEKMEGLTKSHFEDIVFEVSSDRKKILLAINKALRETQL